jgi:hypothetical protein
VIGVEAVLAFCVFAGGYCVLKTGVKPEMPSPPTCVQNGVPLLLLPAPVNTRDTTFVCFGQAHVLGVSKIINRSKIGYPIIRPATILVVYFLFRPMPVIVRPRHPMRQVIPLKDTPYSISSVGTDVQSSPSSPFRVPRFG